MRELGSCAIRVERSSACVCVSGVTRGAGRRQKDIYREKTHDLGELLERVQADGHEVKLEVVPLEERHFRLFERDEDAVASIAFRLERLHDRDGRDDAVEPVRANVRDLCARLRQHESGGVRLRRIGVDTGRMR